MAVVPRNLGLVAALAVSGTALYLVFGYKRKKVVVNVRRGKETWRLEYLHGGSAIQQQQQQQQQKAGSKQESGVRLELHEGKDIAISEIQLQQLPWLRRVIRRLPLQPLLLPPAAGPADDLLPNGSLRRKGALEKRMVNCEGNAAQLTVFQDTLSSFEVEEQQQQQLSESVADFFTFVSSAGGASQSDILGRRDGRSKDASSPSCAEDDCCSEASLSSTASPASSPNSRALVGCFIVPGSRKTAAKPKKVVRFSPSVAEPSSNNQDYRSQFNAQIAERAALQVNRRTHVPSTSNVVAAGSLANDRPKPRHYYYSQAGKGTLTYSVHCYRGRTYY